VAALLLPAPASLFVAWDLIPPARTLLDFLVGMGAGIRITGDRKPQRRVNRDLLVTHAPVRGGVIEKDTTAALIDEIPVLAVLGAASEEGLVIRDASELRIKETDRIATIAENLRRMGIRGGRISRRHVDSRPPTFSRAELILSATTASPWPSPSRRCAPMRIVDAWRGSRVSLVPGVLHGFAGRGSGWRIGLHGKRPPHHRARFLESDNSPAPIA